VVAEGTPEDVAGVEASHTGRFLQQVLADRPAVPVRAKRKKAAAG
jgi:excinuclease ABC subunit A